MKKITTFLVLATLIVGFGYSILEGKYCFKIGPFCADNG